MKVAVLCGAGGSYGEFDNVDLRPPLGNQLFSVLVGRYPATWGALPPEISSEFAEDEDNQNKFELGMAALREEGIHTQACLIDMSIYFASFRLLPGVNRYVALIKCLDRLSDRDSYCFGSLNYETLLEQSLLRVGHSVIYQGDGAGAESPITVLKPHGSCNLVVDPRSNAFHGNTFQNVGAYIAGAPLKCVDLDEVAASAESGVPSAMSLYAPGKPDLVCPEAVAAMRSEWQDMAASSDLLISIGARPNPADQHIWQPILTSSATVAFVGEADSTFDEQVGDRLDLLGQTFETA